MLLELNGLKVVFNSNNESVLAVDNLNFTIDKAQTVGVVGESGSGKTITALSIMKLLPPTASVSGQIIFEGQNLLSLKEKEFKSLRGSRISMVFQEPMTCLNPMYSIGKQIAEVFMIHKSSLFTEAKKATLEILDLVRIPSIKKTFNCYPNELSGGMRQRVMIAMVLACKPSLLIADEPTTALDVTIRAQILDLLKSIQNELKMAILLITHDFGTIWEMCEKVVVMKAGKIMEAANSDEIFSKPKNPYTVELLKSIPSISTKKTRHCSSVELS